MKRTADDARWSAEIRRRAGWTCQRCHKWLGPKSQGLHAAHIFTRSIKKTRLDEDNGIALCYGCHSWGHRNPLDFHEFAKRLLGEDRYEALKVRASRI